MSPLTTAIPVILLIGVIQWLMPSLMPRTLPFGVRIPADRADEPVIAVQRRAYRFGTAGYSLGALALTLATRRHPAAWPAFLAFELLANLALYLLMRKRITAVKQGQGWFDGLRQVTTADTSLSTDPERYPWAWAVPSLVLQVTALVWGIVEYPHLPARLATHFGTDGQPDQYAAKSVGSAFGLVLIQALTNLLLLGLSALVLRSRARLDSEDPQASLRHRRFVSISTRGLLFLTACVNATTLLADLLVWHVTTDYGPWAIALTVAPTGLGLLAILGMVAYTGQNGSRLRLGPAPATAAGPKVVNRDDDRFYRWGLVYFNVDDPAVFVPKRFGVGWTVNFARPTAWLFLLGTVAFAGLCSLIGTLAR